MDKAKSWVLISAPNNYDSSNMTVRIPFPRRWVIAWRTITTINFVKHGALFHRCAKDLNNDRALAARDP